VKSSVKNARYLLEIKALTGIKESSRLSLAACCVGWSWAELGKNSEGPALRRFQATATAVST